MCGITERKCAQVTVQQLLATVESINGVEPAPSRLWKSIRHKDISRPMRGFLWRALQGTFKIGAFWERLGPQYATRGDSPSCKVQESMEHILIECSIEGRSTLWTLAKELWEMRGQEWVPPTYRVALGATLVQIMKKDGTVDVPGTRLYRILVTETVHMIWKIRFQRRIQRDGTPRMKSSTSG